MEGEVTVLLKTSAAPLYTLNYSTANDANARAIPPYLI